MDLRHEQHGFGIGLPPDDGLEKPYDSLLPPPTRYINQAQCVFALAYDCTCLLNPTRGCHSPPQVRACVQEASGACRTGGDSPDAPQAEGARAMSLASNL